MQLKMEVFEKTMSSVYSTTVCEGTIDESPMAYKPMDEIVRLIEPTIEILFFVRPKINIKATDAEQSKLLVSGERFQRIDNKRD